MTNVASLTQSIERCQAITKDAKSNFLIPFRTLSSEKRLAFEVIYAFMRLTDDISDEPEGSGRAQRFRDWRQGLHAAFDGNAGQSPVFPALVHIANKYRIPLSLLDELIDGTEQDLIVTRFRTFKELRAYCYKVASVVGLVSLHIFELEDPTEANLKLSQELAIDCGLAFQMTNILRDIDEDLARDRIYLPQEDLRDFGLKDEDLQSRQATDPFKKLMEHEWQRAQEYYERSAPLASLLTRQAQPCLLTMRAIYYALHQQIRKQHFDVFHSRMKISKLKKVILALRARLFRRGP